MATSARAAARRESVLFLRLTPAEKRLIERAAQEARQGVTHYCRDVLLDTARLAFEPEDKTFTEEQPPKGVQP